MPWDSDFWGFPVAEYRASGFSYGEIRRTLLRGQKEKKRCIFFFLPPGPIRAHHRELEKEKIGLVEQRILMARKTLPSPTCSVPMNLKDVQIRRAKKSDLPTICGLVRRLHRNTRFFKDPRFSRKRAEMLYEKWIRKDFKFGQIFVAAFPDTPVLLEATSPVRFCRGKWVELGYWELTLIFRDGAWGIGLFWLLWIGLAVAPAWRCGSRPKQKIGLLFVFIARADFRKFEQSPACTGGHLRSTQPF